MCLCVQKTVHVFVCINQSVIGCQSLSLVASCHRRWFSPIACWVAVTNVANTVHCTIKDTIATTDRCCFVFFAVLFLVCEFTAKLHLLI